MKAIGLLAGVSAQAIFVGVCLCNDRETSLVFLQVVLWALEMNVFFFNIWNAVFVLSSQ